MPLRFSTGRSLGLALAVLSGLVFAANSEAQDYKIKIHRPEKAGDTFTISAAGESKVAVTADIPGAPPKQEKAFTVQLDGTVKVLEVDKIGSATKFSCTLEKCTLDDKPLFEKGTVITAENQGGKTVYTVNGDKVEQPAAEALEVVIPTHQADDKDDDAAFGTNEPQKVGGTWPVNAAVTAENLSRSGQMPAKTENVKGTGKLTSVKQVDGKDVLQVEVDLNVTDLKGPMPQGATLEGGTLEFHASGSLPADEGGRPLGQETKVKAKMKVKAQSPDNQEVTLDVEVERGSKVTFGEVKEPK